MRSVIHSINHVLSPGIKVERGTASDEYDADSFAKNGSLLQGFLGYVGTCTLGGYVTLPVDENDAVPAIAASDRLIISTCMQDMMWASFDQIEKNKKLGLTLTSKEEKEVYTDVIERITRVSGSSNRE